MDKAADLIKEGGVVAFCGAGVSAESSVPIFRGKGGLWEKYDPSLYVTQEGLLTRLIFHPHDLSNFIIEFYGILLSAEPNIAHYTLADWERLGILSGIITQNVDDFHFQAGSLSVAEIHGNAYVFSCPGCGFSVKKTKGQWRGFLERIKSASSGRRIIKEILGFSGRCPFCHKRLESGIVLFGQSLPREALSQSYELIAKAKTMLCLGTSGVVYPAAAFPAQAKERGAVIINVNPQPCPLDEIADFSYRCEAGEFFRKITLFL